MDANLAYETRAYGDLGDWLPGPWTQRETPTGDYEVVHQQSGKVLATLPDWAAPIALWMCVARDAVPALLADYDDLNQRLHNAGMTRVWTNEDGKKFVFLEDIAPALLGKQDTTQEKR